MPAQRVFHPPVRRSRAALILASVLTLVTLTGGAVLAAIALGTTHVSYAVANGRLTVDSGSPLDGTRAFDLASVVEAREVSLSGGLRTRGTGAPGVCTGVFWYPDLGSVWQATDCRTRAVLLRVTGEEKPIVVSPPDRAAFLAQLEARTDVRVDLPPGDVGLLRVIPGVAAVLALLTTAALVAVFVGGPQRMRYMVGDGRLEVRTMFSRRSWPAHELRASAHAPKVSLRLVGTAFPGYYTGLFRADGATTRLYATDLKSGVLIEGPARVYLSPSSPHAFLEALRAEGAAVG